MNILLITLFLLITAPVLSPADGELLPPIADKAGAETPELDLIAHFPLRDGTVWKYNSNLGEIVSRVRVSGPLYTIRSESSPLDITRHLRLEEKGIMMIGGTSRVYFITTKRTYQPPLLRFPRQTVIGKIWRWEGKEVVDDEIIKSRVEGVIEKKETVRVPAGEFSCLKVKVETVSDDGTKSSSIQWLAPEVGIVKGEVAIDAGGLSGFLIDLLGFDHYNLELVEMIIPGN